MNKTFWVLPDRDQLGDLFVINEDCNEKINLLDFYKKFDIKDSNKNKEFIAGISSELLEKFKQNDFGFGQFLRNKKNNVFSISVRCGVDIDGRTVTLTYIQLVDDEARLPTSDEIEKVSKLDESIKFLINESSQEKINDMLLAVKKYPNIMTFCSDKMLNSRYKHGWNGEDPTYSKKWIWLGVGIIILGTLCFLTLKK